MITKRRLFFYYQNNWGAMAELGIERGFDRIISNIGNAVQ